MQWSDLIATGIGANPRDRVGASFKTCADIELQHDRRLRILRQYFNGPFALDRSEFALVIVIAGLQSRRFELVGGGVQRVGNFLPSLQPGFGSELDMTTYLLPKIRFMSRAFLRFSAVKYELLL